LHSLRLQPANAKMNQSLTDAFALVIGVNGYRRKKKCFDRRIERQPGEENASDNFFILGGNEPKNISGFGLIHQIEHQTPNEPSF